LEAQFRLPVSDKVITTISDMCEKKQELLDSIAKLKSEKERLFAEISK